jgi:hypothetical protein
MSWLERPRPNNGMLAPIVGLRNSFRQAGLKDDNFCIIHWANMPCVETIGGRGVGQCECQRVTERGMVR